MNNFSSWITRKYVEWQAKEGKRKTIEEFAAYLGTSRPLVNMWMNGNKKPGKENIKILAELFGNEVYDILELPRPNPYKQVIDRGGTIYRHSLFFEGTIGPSGRPKKKPVV